ncbi:hypothetical protein AMJ57_03080 [Parcubacteria bacterium SG8_24]|nr:MAG: hypothetical protein AMJ57_03080 [Parcubacteria bacterium SG8_24]
MTGQGSAVLYVLFSLLLIVEIGLWLAADAFHSRIAFKAWRRDDWKVGAAAVVVALLVATFYLLIPSARPILALLGLCGISYLLVTGTLLLGFRADMLRVRRRLTALASSSALS